MSVLDNASEVFDSSEVPYFSYWGANYFILGGFQGGLMLPLKPHISDLCHAQQLVRRCFGRQGSDGRWIESFND